MQHGWQSSRLFGDPLPGQQRDRQAQQGIIVQRRQPMAMQQLMGGPLPAAGRAIQVCHPMEKAGGKTGGGGRIIAIIDDRHANQG